MKSQHFDIAVSRDGLDRVERWFTVSCPHAFPQALQARVEAFDVAGFKRIPDLVLRYTNALVFEHGTAEALIDRIDVTTGAEGAYHFGVEQFRDLNHRRSGRLDSHPSEMAGVRRRGQVHVRSHGDWVFDDQAVAVQQRTKYAVREATRSGEERGSSGRPQVQPCSARGVDEPVVRAPAVKVLIRELTSGHNSVVPVVGDSNQRVSCTASVSVSNCCSSSVDTARTRSGPSAPRAARSNGRVDTRTFSPERKPAGSTAGIRDGGLGVE